MVLGEAKARIHAGDASQFLRNLEKAEKTLAGKRLLPSHHTSDSIVKLTAHRL